MTFDKLRNMDVSHKFILDNLTNAAMLVEASGKIIHANQQAQRLFGQVDRLPSVTWLPRLNECLARGTYEVCCDPTLNCRLVCNSGSGPDKQKIFIEFTENKSSSEAEVMDTHLSRLRELSEMAAGIAHEVNNPMTVVHARAQMLLEKIQNGETIEPAFLGSSLEKMLRQSDRVTKIIRGMQSFSRDASNDLKVPTSVRKMVNETLVLANASIRDFGIEIEVSIWDETAQIECRESEMIQVLLILVNNAIGALRNTLGPKITIHVSGDTHTRVTIMDNGPGVPVGLDQKIFLPFFSTKPVGSGTGIGLSIASRIVTFHGGKLFLNRQKSASCFEIELPPAQVLRQAA